MARKRSSALATIEIFRRRWPAITPLQMAAYLYVAENPGVSILEISLLTDTSISTASRALRALLDEADFMASEPCMGLIRMQPNPNDGRSRMAFLTEEGEELRRQINAKLQEVVLIDASTEDGG